MSFQQTMTGVPTDDSYPGYRKIRELMIDVLNANGGVRVDLSDMADQVWQLVTSLHLRDLNRARVNEFIKFVAANKQDPDFKYEFGEFSLR